MTPWEFSKEDANCHLWQMNWRIAISNAQEFSNKLAETCKSQEKWTISYRQILEYSNRQEKASREEAIG